MRELKFRAWDKKDKKYRKIDMIAFHGPGCFDNNNGLPKVVECWGFDIIDDKNVICHREVTDVEIEQFTGLRDKNGKEIYEGDIINWIDSNGDDARSIVTFEYGVYWTGSCAYDMILGIDFKGDYFEVIGNIHENPELLEARP